MKSTIKFVLDDKIVEVDFKKHPELKPTTTVLNYLRSYPDHKGVKEGCAEGDCGACTVVIAELEENDRLVYKTIDSCLVFLPMIHGKQLITVENLATVSNGEKQLHPVQQQMVETNGSQCGYCTPGIIMSLFGIYKNHNEPSRKTIEDSLSGNLCRCTGYQPIVEAAMKACVHGGSDHFSEKENNTIALLKQIKAELETIHLSASKQKYVKPFTLQEALRERKENPTAIIVNGSTDVALRQTKKKELFREILDLSAVKELSVCREDDENLYFGAGTSIEQVRILSGNKLPAMQKILDVFGSQQIRNLATIGGNIGSASPIGDTLPVLFAYKALVKLASVNGERILPINDFIKGYRATDLKEDELITEVIIPKVHEGFQIISYKVSRRKDLDIATVSGAFSLKLNNGIVDEIILAYGGMAAMTKLAENTGNFLQGKPWTREVVEEAMLILANEFTPLSDARSDAEFRRTAAKNLLLKYFLETKMN